MLGIRREAVYTKLEPIPFRALESAFQLARTRGDAYVELAHWLNQILMQPDSDLHRIVSAFGIDHARLAADMSRTLERIRKGGSAMLDFSEHIDRAIERGWIVASLVFGAGRIRTGHLFLGILDESELTRLLVAISEQFRKVEPERLGRDLARIVEGSPEGEAGTEAVGMRCDVSVHEQVQALAKLATDTFGGVHVLCNNAGVAPGGLAWESTLEDWQWFWKFSRWLGQKAPFLTGEVIVHLEKQS